VYVSPTPGKNELRPYCHIGTGNYNPSTAGVYTDYGLLTCDPELGADVMDLFKYLTGYHRQQSFRKLLVAPTTMRLKFLALIDNEIRHAQVGVCERERERESEERREWVQRGESCELVE
jgi:polyphosphate kinase